MNQEKIDNLIGRCKEHDTTAFRQLVETCQPYVFRLAFRLLCDEEDAKDIVQETLIRVWQHLHRYNEKMRFSTWLYKIACNLCYDRLRAMKREPSNPKTSVELSDIEVSDEWDTEQSVINRNLREWITKLTDNLSPKQRLIFTLRDLEGLELEEVEKITGMGRAKIKSNLYLARKQIKEELKVETTTN